MITAKAVIFDLDCTLIDTLDRFFDLFNELLIERGDKPLSRTSFLKRYVDDTLDDVVAPVHIDRREERLHKFWMEFLVRYRKDGPCGKLIPGVRQVFKKLGAARIPIAVITSCIVPSAELKRELAGWGLDSYVKTITTAHDVAEDIAKGHHFSKVEIFQNAVKNLGVRAEDCVVVGDYWNDIRDGKKVGAKTVAVLTGQMRRQLLEKYGPDAIIDGVKDLLKVVQFERGD